MMAPRPVAPTWATGPPQTRATRGATRLRRRPQQGQRRATGPRPKPGPWISERRQLGLDPLHPFTGQQHQPSVAGSDARGSRSTRAGTSRLYLPKCGAAPANEGCRCQQRRTEVPLASQPRRTTGGYCPQGDSVYDRRRLRPPRSAGSTASHDQLPERTGVSRPAPVIEPEPEEASRSALRATTPAHGRLVAPRRRHWA